MGSWTLQRAFGGTRDELGGGGGAVEAGERVPLDAALGAGVCAFGRGRGERPV